METETVELDEKCLAILEEIDKQPELGMTFEDLYDATSPTTEKDLEKRIYNLKEAGLIVNGDDIFYRKTVVGDYVEKKLNGKPFRNWMGYIAEPTDCAVF
jgi:hypothetical protein